MTNNDFFVWLVFSFDLETRATLLHVVCLTPEKADDYIVGLRQKYGRAWKEKVMCDHLLGSSFGAYTIPKHGGLY